MKKKLRLPPPPGRTAEQLWNHFEVERAIAARLLQADRPERTRIYRTMYDELFAKVPDHPRLTVREDARRTGARNRERLQLLRRFIRRETVVAEFGPGDCRFSFELCRHARLVYGIDISDQIGTREGIPENFRLIVYDGYRLPLDRSSVDVFFSDQLIEHLHPEDVTLHFETVNDVLRHGGVYLFRTPHCFTGPHDVSRYFSDEPRGFHLKEWTYTELVDVVRRAGYRSPAAYAGIASRWFRVPTACFTVIERLLHPLPRPIRRTIARVLLRGICIAAWR